MPGGGIAFLESGPEGGHAMVVGGLTVLERRVRELAKAGTEKVIVAAEPVALPDLAIPVEFVAAGSAPPDGARREPADEIAGIRVTDAQSRKAAEWALLRRMNKSYEGPVDALINWRFSMRLTRQLARTRLTPNHVTIVAILTGFAGAALAMRGGYLGVALAGVLLQLNSILDSCDGELARLRFQFSKLGQWLDNLADDIVDNVFIIAIGVGLGGIWLWLGLAAAGGRWLVNLWIYVSVYRDTGSGDIFAYRWWFERGAQNVDAVYDPRSPITWLRSFGRRDTYVLVWMIVCLAGFPHWIIGHGLVIGAVQVSLLLLHLTIGRSRRP